MLVGAPGTRGEDATEARIDRRSFVGYAGIGAGTLILGGVPVDPALAQRRRRRGHIPLARGGSFPQGVAAGEPSDRAMTLWTRLDGIPGDRRLFLEVSRDRDFRRVVARREVRARGRRDFTVERRVRGLRPGREYFYRFETRDGSSPVGRFRTLRPQDSREPLRIALLSCQAYTAGYYNAHRVVAGRDVDLVLFLGDYIYEHSTYQGPREDRTGANRDGDVQTLSEYRQKYRLYKSDPDLRALHAAHPFMAIWDDHDVQNDYAGNEPGLGEFPRRIPFVERRRAAYRAFYEYMPFAPVVNRPRSGLDLYRRRRIGRNVELFLLDERQFRDPQPCESLPLVPCPQAESTPRAMLGRDQLAWLKAGLESSTATWKLIGNQVMIMAFELGAGTPVYKDQWDGYGVERRELLGHIQARGLRDVSFITGDFHSFFAGDVGNDGRGPESVATEFVVGSTTSLSDVDAAVDLVGVGISPDQAAAPYRAAVAANPHIKYNELLSRGFGILEARPDELLVQYRAVNTETHTTDSRQIGRFRVAPGVPRVEVL